MGLLRTALSISLVFTGQHQLTTCFSFAPLLQSRNHQYHKSVIPTFPKFRHETNKSIQPNTYELSSTSSNTESQQTQHLNHQKKDHQVKSTHACKYCKQEFPSRNGLFRHVRSSAECTVQFLQEGGKHAEEHLSRNAPRRGVVLLLGYRQHPYDHSVDNEVNVAEEAMTKLQKAFVATFLHFSNPSSPTMFISDIQMTRASAVQHRHIALAQENQCSAAGDVVTVRYRSTLDPDPVTPNDGRDLIRLLNYYLDLDFQQEQKELHEQSECENVNDRLSSVKVKVLGAESLSSKLFTPSFHAERDSTQIAHHYLVPLSWLPDGRTSLIPWFMAEASRSNEEYYSNGNIMSSSDDNGLDDGSCVSVGTKDSSPGNTNTIKRNSNTKKKRSRFGQDQNQMHCTHKVSPPQSLKLWKEALKSAASPQIQEKTASTAAAVPSYVSKANSRFRGLQSKQKRCWHNFADPNLKGHASPSNNPVWNCLDRAKTIDFVVTPTNQDVDDDGKNDEGDIVNDANVNVSMVVELRAEGFVTQQTRRIIGTAIAITHGWLPADFFDIATRPDVVVETPIAPLNAMYFAGVRYDFCELKRCTALFDGGGGSGDNAGTNNDCQLQWIRELRECIAQEQCNENNRKEVENEHWLQYLKDVVTPRIRYQLNQISKEDASRRNSSISSSNDYNRDINVESYYDNTSRGQNGTTTFNHQTIINTRVPKPYRATLGLLRDLVSRMKWPTTSIARAKVIREGDSNVVTQSGSFTLVNTNLICKQSSGVDSIILPMGNRLFPDLAETVFELEKELISLHNLKRSSSTHCAINRNAQFKPHVDSGRGAGQSVSMIVGMGNYFNGGQIIVEGVGHNIRYKPLEFDGWRLRHWTEKFEGERFSLVWFTPEII